MTTPDYRQIRAGLLASYGDAGAQRRDDYGKQPWKLAEREAFAGRLIAANLTRLLEIGAGTGQDSVYFTERGLTVVATDASPEMVARCAAKGLDARVMDFGSLGFPAAAFDAVHAMNCLLHIPNAELPRVLGEVARVLRPGGLFFLGVYGGRAEEGPMEWDDHVPVRFFSFRTDEQIVAYAGQHFEIVDFHLAQSHGQHGFQSLTLRRP